jgi:antitoxin ParD1/3/4
MNVHLTPQLESLVRKKVKTGRYNSASEVVREALRLLEEHDRIRAAHLTQLRNRIDEGLASLDRGEGVDGEQFMTELTSGVDAKPARRKVK